MLMGENGLLEHAKWGSFATAFREVEEEQMLYESDKMIEEVIDNTKLGVEEEKGVKGEVSEEEKKEIEENNRSLAIKMQELSGKPVEEMEIYWIDESKIKNVKDEKYILDVETSQLYKYEGEKIYGKIWHTLDEGIREDDEYIENSDKENWEGWIKLTLNYPEG